MPHCLAPGVPSPTIFCGHDAPQHCVAQERLPTSSFNEVANQCKTATCIQNYPSHFCLTDGDRYPNTATNLQSSPQLSGLLSPSFTLHSLNTHSHTTNLRTEMGIPDQFGHNLTSQLRELPVLTPAQVECWNRQSFGQFTYGNSSKPFREILQVFVPTSPFPEPSIPFVCLPGPLSFNIFQEALIEMSLQRRDSGSCRVTSKVNSSGQESVPEEESQMAV